MTFNVKSLQVPPGLKPDKNVHGGSNPKKVSFDRESDKMSFPPNIKLRENFDLIHENAL